MSIKRILGWATLKLYNVGAGVVIFGLILQLIGHPSNKTVVIIGLIMECGIFILSAIVIDESSAGDKKEEEDKSVDNKNKFRKIYYMDENGRYYIDNPSYIQGLYENPVSVVGIPNSQSRQSDFYFSTLSAEISKLEERLGYLKSIWNNEGEKYIAEKSSNSKKATEDETKEVKEEKKVRKINNDEEEVVVKKKRKPRVSKKRGRSVEAR